MFNKPNRWMFVFLVVLFVATLVLWPAPASAAQTIPPSTNSCLTCHEDLYYLHDTGKLYCLTEHTDRCVNCHEGNASVMNKDESHLGLIVHPQDNNGAKCQECHTPQDAQVRLVTFEANGGFADVIKAEAYIPSAEVEPGFPEVSPTIVNWKWAAGAFIFFGLWLVLVFFSPLKP
jgi:nitrate/TMAO reductase-like tetraheme cytochrome c subunit